MNNVNITNVVISKGYEDRPAIRYSNSDNGGVSSALFRVGEKVYDKRAQDNYRWNNWNVKAFGNLAERISKMKLDAGSFINLTGRLDMDTWEDNGTKRSAPVIILSELEYCYSGNKNSNGNNENGHGSQNGNGGQYSNNGQNSNGSQYGNGNSGNNGQNQQNGMPKQANPAGASDNFTGFEGFGGGTNPFFPE